MSHSGARAIVPALCLSLLTMCGGHSSSASQTPTPTPTPTPAPPPGPWMLTWSDEFDGADGSRPDESRWTYDIGGGGYGNQELESYTNRLDNVTIEKGALVITARAEHFTGPDGIPRDYTSARLKTDGRFGQTYGRFEARMQIPRGQGIWPEFWLLGAYVSAVGWPGCGEIDIMENIGREPNTVHGTFHGPGYSGASGIGAAFQSADGKPFADGYHLYAVEWDPAEIRWYVDDHLYETRKPSDLPGGTRWVFDHDFFIIINVAVGGSWPGNPDNTSVFPQQMIVDFVSVYKR
jgi:beta-glucanase (GH16 family)